MQTKSKKTGKMTLESLMERLPVVKVARKMKVTRPTVLRWIQSGRLKAVRSPMDGRWLIHPDDLAEFQRPEIGNPDWLAKR